MRWKRRDEISNEQVVETAKQLNINELMARILLNRNMTPENIRVVMQDTHEGIIEPTFLTNAKSAAERIAEYCRNPNAAIWIYGDYDADGITSLYILTSALREVAVCQVEAYCPERSEGYGLNMDFCKKVVEFSSASKEILVITVDNGIACIDEVNYLTENNIEVIVTDHHMAKEQVPNCLIVNPHNHNEPDTFKHLAGCGVAFKVAQLVQREFDVYNMMNYVFAVAIGTLADVMPMSIENIAFIKYGLEQINSKDCPLGIKAMKDYMGKSILTSTEIAWEIAPRINACGRMGNVNLAAKLFFEELDFEETIEDIINAIETLNTNRKQLTKQAQKIIEKTNFDNESVCVLDASEYPEGIIGIIANKVVEFHKKPTIIVSGKGKTMTGSARSIKGISLQQILKKAQEDGTVEQYGGHEVAAGLTIKKEKFEEFKTNVSKSVSEMIQTLPAIEDDYEQELVIDELINLVHLNKSTYELVNAIPYDNKSFCQPTFALIDVDVEKTSVSKNNPNNIRFDIKDSTTKMSIWGWGMASLYKELGEPKKIHIAGTVERDFTNPSRFTLKIIDILSA